MRRVIFIVAIVSGLLPAAARAQAQAQGQTPTPTNDAANVDEIRKNARMHVGPLYISPALLLKEAGIDSNVFNQAVDPKSDFTMTVTPQADIAITFARRALLTTTVGSDLVYYANYATE